MTWSLYEKEENEDSEGAGLFDYTGKELGPLKFSNGKTQEDVVKEVLSEIEKGVRVIFIKGVCGSGKSAIALNLARHFKKTSIVVPIKNLQDQYEKDYTQKKYLLGKDKKKLKISVLKGRGNFSCAYLGGYANAGDLPCDIEFREQNKDKILGYINQNEFVLKTDFDSVSDVRRMSVAPACPYWSPLLPSDMKSKVLENSKKKKYMAVCGKEFCFYQRKKGCGYYDQYESYIDSDVLIFNSAKYLLEMAIGRKPKTDLDIIDECDEFLDKFAQESKINLNRFANALSKLFPTDSEERDAIKDMIFWSNKILEEGFESGVMKIKDSRFLKILKKVLDNPYIAEEEDNNYYNKVLEIAKSFEHLWDESYISFESVKSDDGKLFGKPIENVFVSIVSINLAQRLKEVVDANNVLVLMSGTLHSEEVLRDIFGLDNFKIIEAEHKQPGVINKIRTGFERNFSYANMKSGNVTREGYLKALSAAVANAKPPTLVHVSSFGDLPSEDERIQFGVNNLPTREELKEMQKQAHVKFNDFKNKATDILFTTRCSRGVDFPGEECNSIVITKYPYPNIRDLFWQILKKEKPEKFTEFYFDKAKRDLIQRISRGVRFSEDYVLLLSPDERVFRIF